jgi:hypothetical protein
MAFFIVTAVKTSNPTNVIQFPLSYVLLRVLGYRSGGPGLILGTTRKKVVGLEGVHSAS